MTDYLQRIPDFKDPEVVSAYDEVFFWSARFGGLLLKHLDLRRNSHILDLACGTGFPLFELAHLCGGSCQLTGVDVWKEALERARAKLKVYGLPNVHLVEADAAALPFADASFDLIVSNLGINNFADRQAALNECFRVARPGARIALTSNLQGHMQEFYALYRVVLTDLGNAEYLERLDAHETHRATKASASRLLEVAGFTITRVVEDSFQFRYLDGTAFFNHWLTRLGFLEEWRGVVNPDDEQQVFARLEARLNEQAVLDGELRMTVPMLYLEGQKPVMKNSVQVSHP